MADTVADVNEKIVGTPEKKPIEKVVDDVEEVDDDSKPSENGDTNGDAIKENGTSDEKDSADDSDKLDKNGDEKLGENGHDKNGKDSDVEVIASKRKSGGDVSVGALAEGASPEKKAKLDEPVEVEANGDTEVAA